jgi:hypothetical protein
MESKTASWACTLTNSALRCRFGGLLLLLTAVDPVGVGGGWPAAGGITHPGRKVQRTRTTLRPHRYRRWIDVRAVHAVRVCGPHTAADDDCERCDKWWACVEQRVRQVAMRLFPCGERREQVGELQAEEICMRHRPVLTLLRISECNSTFDMRAARDTTFRVCAQEQARTYSFCPRGLIMLVHTVPTFIILRYVLAYPVQLSGSSLASSQELRAEKMDFKFVSSTCKNDVLTRSVVGDRTHWDLQHTHRTVVSL